jgi:hypothetical protein
MLAASSVGIFVIPMLYVVFQRLREKTQRKNKGRTGASYATGQVIGTQERLASRLRHIAKD